MGFRPADIQRLARDMEKQAGRLALRVTDQAATQSLVEFRNRGRAAGMGGLVNAVGAGSDLKKKRSARLKGGNLVAYGWLVHRTKLDNKRTRGALESFLAPSTTITPRNASGLLWFPTDDLRRIVKVGDSKKRLEAHMWNKLGLDKKIGPLVPIDADDGTPLLILKRVGVNAAGRRRLPRSLKRNGQPRRGDEIAETLVAFIGIPNTKRVQRVDLKDIVDGVLRRVTSQAKV